MNTALARSSTGRKSQTQERAHAPARCATVPRSVNDRLLQMDLASQEVMSRLTDPNQYPPAYRAKFEAIRKHNETFRSSDKLSEKRAASTNNLSQKEAEVVKRLTDVSSKSKSKSSLEKIEYSGYTNGFKPIDEAEKERMRAKALSQSNRIDHAMLTSLSQFFNEFSPKNSRNGSRRASVQDPASSSRVSTTRSNPALATWPGRSEDAIVAAPKTRKQSMTGLVDDMPPPKPIAQTYGRPNRL
ncbi:hypothetical protein HK105_205916 [Polyrhizophydium stewartii]|uniref:Uncharacterized protein n=1 Tax=Polyrhizophydium stewartii TaxID=2732419 RepID=A0ABR4N4X9_9FUNG